MSTFTKRIAVLAAIVLSLALVVSCGKKGPSGSVVLEFWEQDDANMQKAYDALIQEFMTANPNITVKRVHHETEDLRKNFTSAAIGGGGPDVIMGPNDNLGVFVPGDLIVDLSTIVDKSLLSKFDQASLDAGKYYGTQYMLPDRNGNQLMLIYNKEIVKEAPKTFEELEKISAELKAAKKVQYGLVFNIVEPYFTIPFLFAFNGNVFDNPNAKNPKPTLDTPAMKEWFTFLKRIHSEGLIPKEADYDVAQNLFKEGKAAFLINGPWSLGDLEVVGIEYGLAPIPTIKGGQSRAYNAVKGYVVSQTAVKDENKKAAVRVFLEFLSTKDSQLKLSKVHKQLPTLKDAIADPSIQNDPDIAGQKEPLRLATPMPTITEMRAVWDAIKPVQQELFSGKVTPEEAGPKMQKRAEDGIKALGIK
jgi:maltose-binding protein MalE